MSGPDSSSPLWKDEFSVHAADERYVSRRQFSKFLVLTSLAMLAGQVWILVKSWFAGEAAAPPQVAVARKGEIGVGEVKLFTYPTDQDHCILVRTAPDTYVAYSQKCTHLSCAVYYSRQSNQLACPCHRGFFAVEDGRVLAGPPQRPLPRIQLEARGDELVAIGVKERA
ncbi:MAG TPA: Rieske (2Fe-2S) protein [Terriglobales bacterium]|nr:Rieske (2Fe-2S) protein [Terriglobales bacterium]